MVKVKTATHQKLKKHKNVPDVKAKKVTRIKKRTGTSRRGRRGIQKKNEREPTGVVYISHIPHGFYEEQIEAYFSQFGKVTAVSVPRSKSGKARGYAFIEYRHPEIAKIAAETMNNYLMLNRLLKAKYIPPEQQKPHLFYLAKAARENHTTAADRAALAVKHNRKLKNRHLKINLEAKCAAKLLKKKKSLMERAKKLGTTDDVVVEEASLLSVFERKKEILANKKNKSEKQDQNSENGEESDTSDQLSSSQGSVDTESLESVDFISESEEEDYKKVISKAKKAAKNILKQKSKPTKLETSNKSQTVLHSSPQLLSHNNKESLMLPQNEIMTENENIFKNNKLQSSKSVERSKKLNTSMKSNLSETEAIEDDITVNKNMTPKRLKERKRWNKNVGASVSEKTPPSTRKRKISAQTPTSKKSDISPVIMEVDKNDEENEHKTPPKVIKKFSQRGSDSSTKKTKDKSITQPLTSPKNHRTSKNVLQEGIKSPRDVSSAISKKSPLGKKPRHRKLKNMLSPAQ